MLFDKRPVDAVDFSPMDFFVILVDRGVPVDEFKRFL